MNARQRIALAAATAALGGGVAFAPAAQATTDGMNPHGSTTGSAAASAQAAPMTAYYGTYQHSDGCVYLVSSSGTHYYLPGYTMGGNGGLYKKGGGFVAYPGWRIQANGKASTHSGGSTLCTTWGVYHQIKATSIYSS